MKAFASLLAFAIALAPAAALAETPAPGVAAEAAPAAPVKKDAKKRQHAKTQPSRRAHSQQHNKDLVTVSTRSVQKTPKEGKSHGADKTSKKDSGKTEKKADAKHPAGSAAFDHEHAAEPKANHNILGSKGDGVKDLEPLPAPEVAPKGAHPRSHGVKRVSLPEPKRVVSPEPSVAPSKGKRSATPAKAQAGAKTEAPAAAKKCFKEPVTFLRGAEVESFPLQQCDGSLAPLAVEHLSIALRPHGVAKPEGNLERLAAEHGKDQFLAANLRKVDARLIMRLGDILEATNKGKPAKVSIVSGYRPQSQGSQHSLGRAMDFRIDGVDNERVVAACKGMTDVGCGFYPNSSFVHLDVRDAGTGHVSWIDASGPGEAPKYVTAWPPPAPAAAVTPASEAPSAPKTDAPEGDEPSAQ